MKRALGLCWLASVLGCSGPGNDGQPIRNKTWVEDGVEYHLFDEVPWANRATPQFDEEGNLKISEEPLYPPIATGMPDPGSREVDCSGLEDIEVSSYYVDNFEPFGSGAVVGIAPGWSSYDDGSDASFRVPGDADWYPDYKAKAGNQAPFGLASDRLEGNRPQCDGGPNDWAVHYRGGRFNWYGGGMARPFTVGRLMSDGTTPETCPPGSDLCVLNDDGSLTLGNDGLPVKYWDVSAYDGVVFWARRGPEGATALLVGLQDRHTSDDLAKGNPNRECERIKTCRPNCVNGFECITNPDIVGDERFLHRCMPPGFDETVWRAEAKNPALLEFVFPRCDVSTCIPPWFNPDTDFDNTECKPYQFTGLEENYWCYGDTPPPPPAERCGDGFVAPISLSTDWKLYKLPFDSFRQVGFGKRAPSFDLKTLYSVAFQFTVGYTDVYVDNLSFYRNR